MSSACSGRPHAFRATLHSSPVLARVLSSTKGLTTKSAQTPLHRYRAPLLERIESGKIDPSIIITTDRMRSAGAR